ncbi:hypothetical protein [Geodermatophilus chilensis]|uniref:hypothetical protein n=1 Tax=Geodermatophilus chilensis TaxID=2035835 RepID=UPI001E300A3C|nr:hypothetical protein [Geodermatophilus chilensis]
MKERHRAAVLGEEPGQRVGEQTDDQFGTWGRRNGVDAEGAGGKRERQSSGRPAKESKP